MWSLLYLLWKYVKHPKRQKHHVTSREYFELKKKKSLPPWISWKKHRLDFLGNHTFLKTKIWGSFSLSRISCRPPYTFHMYPRKKIQVKLFSWSQGTSRQLGPPAHPAPRPQLERENTVNLSAARQEAIPRIWLAFDCLVTSGIDLYDSNLLGVLIN